MKKKITNFTKEVGTFTVALTLAFTVFLGVMIVRGAFQEPTGSPSDPASNAPSPINVNVGTQVKQGKIAAEDFFSVTASTIDPTLGWMSQIAQRITDVRETYHLEATAATANLTVPLDLPTFYRLCADENGCRVVVGAKNLNPNRPGVNFMKGPHMLHLGTPFAGGLGRGWAVSLLHPPLTAEATTNGLDNDGVVSNLIQHFVSVSFPGGSISAIFCQLTDGEYVLPSGGSIPQFNQSDTLEGFGLRRLNQTNANYANTVCTLDIED